MIIQQTLYQNEYDFNWHKLNTQHAFMHDEGDKFDAALAMQIYNMTIDFCHDTLRL